MKLVKLYEDIIREGKAQGCVAKFGQELFDPQLSKDNDVEPNTETETDYLKLIGQFTTYHHGRALRPVFIDAVKTLKTCISSYPEVLEPEGTAFRGDNMTLSDLLDQYQDIADDLKDDGEFDFTYKPKSMIQSWTVDKYSAGDFATLSPFLLQTINTYKKVKGNPDELKDFIGRLVTQLDEISVPIIIRLDTTVDDFLFKSKYFKELSKHDHEQELLRINNQPTRVTATIKQPLFQPVFDLLKAIKQYEVYSHRQP